MKKLLLTGLVILVFSSFHSSECEKWKEQADYYKKLFHLSQECVSLMDFTTQKAKDSVLKIHYEMLSISIQHVRKGYSETLK